MNLNRLSSHLSPKALCPFAVYGVPCFVGHAPTLLTELKDLTRNGIVLYA